MEAIYSGCVGVMAARNKYDWDTIHREYRTGLLSDSELCRKHGCSRGALQSKITLRGWTKDLTREVNQATRAALITEDAKHSSNQASNQAEDNAKDKDEIELAAQTRVEVVRQHRRDITKLRDLEQSLLDELGDKETKPTKVHVSNYQGVITETVLGIAVTERAAALQALAGVQHKRIALERQAFNLDEDDGGSIHEKTLDDLK